MRVDTQPSGSEGTLVAGRYEGSPEGVRIAIAAAKKRLGELRASDEELFAAELVLAEALNNVVEHALHEAEEPAFDLALRHHQRGVAVEIRDRGTPMPDGRPPIGSRPIIPDRTEDLPEGGFGWFLIRELARDLVYARVGEENRLSFRLAICVVEPA